MEAQGTAPPGPPARDVRDMFARISPTYDLLNRLLSAGRDAAWRRAMVRSVDTGATRILDLCTGTGDLALEIKRRRPSASVLAGDFCYEMLDRGRPKGLLERCSVATVDALQLPYATESFDAVLVAFGARNFAELPRGLAEIHRVLRRRGQLAVLDFFAAPSAWRDLPFRLYFRHVLPRVGRWVSRDAQAYTYLPESVGRFVTRPEFVQALRDAGFDDIQKHEMTLGIATLFLARRGSGAAQIAAS